MNRVSLLRAAHGLRAMCRTLRAVAALVAPLACFLPWAAQATQLPAGTYPPIVFLHGNGDMASQWQTQLWRFESNGWPRERLIALRHPFPLARTQDDVPQAGRSSAAEHMAFLAAAVERIGQVAGGQKVVLVGNSRGGTAIRNYIVNGGGAGKVSHAILGGTPNHGVWAIPGYLEGSEFSGLSPLLRQLNAPKNADGDEVTGPVQWMTLRSDNNDRYAQPDGRWLKLPGQPTYVGYDSPALRGAHNVVLPGADHREVSYSRAAFVHTWTFITGQPPHTTEIVAQAQVALRGAVTGLGLDPLDASSGNFTNNLPLPGATVELWRVDPETGVRQGEALLRQVTGEDGRWGPAVVPAGRPVELVVSAEGYATTHYYRSGFPRSSDVVDLRAMRIPAAHAHADSVVILWRPRGYLDPSRPMQLDGAAPPNVPPGSGVSYSIITPSGGQRTIRAMFDGEQLVGQTWPARDGHLVYLEITH